MRSYSLTDAYSSGSHWDPHPGDMIVGGTVPMYGQWPPDGCRTWDTEKRFFSELLKTTELDVHVPFLVVSVTHQIVGSFDVYMLQHGRLWWKRLKNKWTP